MAKSTISVQDQIEKAGNFKREGKYQEAYEAMIEAWAHTNNEFRKPALKAQADAYLAKANEMKKVKKEEKKD